MNEHYRDDRNEHSAKEQACANAKGFEKKYYVVLIPGSKIAIGGGLLSEK